MFHCDRCTLAQEIPQTTQVPCVTKPGSEPMFSYIYVYVPKSVFSQKLSCKPFGTRVSIFSLVPVQISVSRFYDTATALHIFWLTKVQIFARISFPLYFQCTITGHMWSAKSFSAWPLCDLTSFLKSKEKWSWRKTTFLKSRHKIAIKNIVLQEIMKKIICTWNIRRLVDETIVPATQRIILKIVGFLHWGKVRTQEYQKGQFWFESDRLPCGSFGVAPKPIHF